MYKKFKGAGSLEPAKGSGAAQISEKKINFVNRADEQQSDYGKFLSDCYMQTKLS